MQKIFLSLLLSLVLATPALANNTASPREVKRELRQEIRDTKKDVREEIKDKRKEVREEVKEAREKIKETREKAREEIKEKRETFKKDLEVKRDELKKRLETKREELKVRLEKIKDERKKNLVQKIDRSLDALNDRRVRHYTAVLDQIEKILERIDKRIERAEERGLNVTAVKAAEETAKVAIARSREAVKVQATKTYTITVGTEETLKENIRRARQALHNDLKNVEATVKAAREAVRKTAVALAQIPRIDEAASPTSTPPSTDSQ